jgi:hypothetical protein
MVRCFAPTVAWSDVSAADQILLSLLERAITEKEISYEGSNCRHWSIERFWRSCFTGSGQVPVTPSTPECGIRRVAVRSRWCWLMSMPRSTVLICALSSLTSSRTDLSMPTSAESSPRARLDVIVHNAGHMAFGPAEAVTPEQFAQLYDGNCAVIGGGFDRQVCGFPYRGRIAWHLKKGAKRRMSGDYETALEPATTTRIPRSSQSRRRLSFDRSVTTTSIWSSPQTFVKSTTPTFV